MPCRGKRYGLNVSKKYDNGSDAWLMMDGNPGEWAVAFHGVNSPENRFENTTVLKSILQGKSKGEMLKAGTRQTYENSQALNCNSRVGRGIYCSPHF